MINDMKIPVGIESFEELRRNGRYYIDKTRLIHSLTHDTFNKVTLFTRPCHQLF